MGTVRRATGDPQVATGAELAGSLLSALFRLAPD